MLWLFLHVAALFEGEDMRERTWWPGRHLQWAALMTLLISLLACDLPTATTGSGTPNPNRNPDAARHHIAVRTVGGQAQLFDVVTGRPYTPRGVNLIHLVTAENGQLQDRSFAVGVYRHGDLAAIFDRLHHRGFNTVRMFLDACQGGAVCLTRPGQPG